MKSLAVKLSKRGACSDAVAWVEATKGTPQEVWDHCQRGDWMLWLLGKLSGKPESAKRKLVRATCGCVRLALKFVAQGEDRPRICIETTEAWAEGKATIQQVKEARSDALAAANAAAGAAANAAYAADAAANAAADAAANAAANAANAAANAANARKKMLADYANVVRNFFPKAPRL